VYSEKLLMIEKLVHIVGFIIRKMKEFYVIMQKKTKLFKNCKMIRPELGKVMSLVF
jgi:hypothetical protein